LHESGFRVPVPHDDRDETHHSFGGAWTEEKLEVLGQYLRKYNEALKNQSFGKW